MFLLFAHHVTVGGVREVEIGVVGVIVRDFSRQLERATFDALEADWSLKGVSFFWV